MLNDPGFILSLINPFLFLKIAFLIIIGLFAIFTYILFNQSCTMNTLVEQSSASKNLRFFTIINILLAVSLFLTALVIL